MIRGAADQASEAAPRVSGDTGTSRRAELVCEARPFPRRRVPLRGNAGGTRTIRPQKNHSPDAGPLWARPRFRAFPGADRYGVAEPMRTRYGLNG